MVYRTGLFNRITTGSPLTPSLFPNLSLLPLQSPRPTRLFSSFPPSESLEQATWCVVGAAHRGHGCDWWQPWFRVQPMSNIPSQHVYPPPNFAQVRVRTDNEFDLYNTDSQVHAIPKSRVASSERHDHDCFNWNFWSCMQSTSRWKYYKHGDLLTCCRMKPKMAPMSIELHSGICCGKVGLTGAQVLSAIIETNMLFTDALSLANLLARVDSKPYRLFWEIKILSLFITLNCGAWPNILPKSPGFFHLWVQFTSWSVVWSMETKD